MNKWYQLKTEDVLKELGTDAVRGLSGSEAAVRLNRHGLNELVDRGQKSPWAILWEQMTALMVIILIVAAVASAALGDWKDAIAILTIVILNAILGFSQEYRAEKAMAALKRMSTPLVRIRRDGQVREISSRELVPGDVVLLEAGNVVPADLRLMESANLRIQEAALTGESEPVEKDTLALEDKEAAIGDRHNMAFMGTVVTYGRGQGVVVETGMNTELGAIAAMIQTVESEPTPLQKRMDQLGRGLAVAAVGARGGDLYPGHHPRRVRDRQPQADVPDGRQHGCGRRSGRTARRRDDRAGAGRPTHAEAERADPKAARRGDAGLGDRHLFRQDRHADGK